MTFPTPIFTSVDDGLLRGDSLRDPLGMQPVWSSVGRRLVPYLATTVEYVEGIIAVMAIERLREQKLSKVSQRNRLRYWRLMEGLFGYHLENTERREPCHGSRTLKTQGSELELTGDETNILCNGLRQYYRGTCVRAGMIGANDRVSTYWRDLLDPIFKRHVSALSRLRESMNVTATSEIPLKPERLQRDLEPMWEGLLIDSPIRERLKRELLGDDPHIWFAEWSAKAEKPDTRLRFCEIRTLAVTSGRIWPLMEDLSAVFNCAPFISLLDTIFDLLRGLDGESLDNTYSLLSEATCKTIKETASAFLKLKECEFTVHIPRFASLFELASKSNKTEDFIRGLIEHHISIMRERDKPPLVRVDVGRLLVTAPNPDYPEELNIESKEDILWRYDFYAGVAARIYEQLFRPVQ